MRFRPSLRVPALLCLLVPLASCASAPSSRAPADPDPRQAAAAWDSATSPDTVAGWTLRACSRGRVVATACVERTLYAALERGGITLAMTALDRMAERTPVLRSDAHGLAHGLGIAAYRSPETVGTTFAACPPTQQAGCYHGVIQGYFLALKRDRGEVPDAVLNGVCEEQRARSYYLFFQCTHGLGHGVVALAGHDLPRGLALCDRLADPAVRQNCYGGAFMENLVAFTHPHHTAEAHAAAGAEEAHTGHGETATAGSGHAEHGGEGMQGSAHAGHAGMTGHEGHAGHGTAPAQPWKPFDRNDLHYPCSVMAPQYQPACYDNQATAILFFTNGDVARTARECQAAPAGSTRACFFSLGRYLASREELDARRAVTACAVASEPGRGWCGISVATLMVNQNADARAGLRTCVLLEGNETKSECYRRIGAMLRTYEGDPARRETVCATSEPAFAAACRRGAELPARSES